jgi:chromate reductase
MAKIILIAMSLRKESFNKKNILNVQRILEKKGADVEVLSFNDYPMPVYSADDEAEKGFPEGVKNLVAKFQNARAIIFSTPEYNGGIPGPFKNALDYISRTKPNPWAQKHILLLGASPGGFGALRSLWHCRNPLEAEGGFVFPDMLGLSKAHEAFDADGKLKEAKQEEMLDKLLQKFLDHLKSSQL